MRAAIARRQCSNLPIPNKYAHQLRWVNMPLTIIYFCGLYLWIYRHNDIRNSYMFFIVSFMQMPDPNEYPLAMWYSCWRSPWGMIWDWHRTTSKAYEEKCSLDKMGSSAKWSNRKVTVNHRWLYLASISCRSNFTVIIGKHGISLKLW